MSKMTPKTFTDEQCDTFMFDHQFTEGGKIHGGLAVVTQHDDGYCTCAAFNALGIQMPLITCFSGCLTPTTQELNEDQCAALEQVRKAAAVMQKGAL